ncbi:hypothetical protein RUM43_000190 [Polyplax serrata]|uniref:Uncharacterized protein n=1 Tax=Polyplax serrata TaxID=468196 RepID=A0AAN8SGG3_POLSC
MENGCRKPTKSKQVKGEKEVRRQRQDSRTRNVTARKSHLVDGTRMKNIEKRDTAGEPPSTQKAAPPSLQAPE